MKGQGSEQFPWQVVFAGGGPAGTGPLLNAAKEGTWDRLVALGVCVIESGDALCVGNFDKYSGHANSHGNAFTHVLREGRSGAVLPRTTAAVAAGEWAHLAVEVPRLETVGAFMRALGIELAEALAAAGSEVLLRTRVVSARRRGDLWEVTSEGPDGKRVDFARWLAVNMGGEELFPSTFGRSAVTPESWRASAALNQSQVPMATSSEFLKDVKGWRARLPPTPKVLLVGGAHSTWLAVDVIAAEIPGASVTVLRRSRTPMFFYSTADADAAGVAYGPEDLCEQTGRVNRFSGVRGVARARAMGKTEGLGGLVISETADDEEVLALLNAADLVITATGYRPRLPELIGADGRRIVLSMKKDGQLSVSAKSRPISSSHGAVEDQLLLYGLGSGWPLEPKYGGEPRLFGNGRLDGVWLYQFDVGKVVAESLLPSRGETWHYIYCKKGVRALDDTPLHHLGGYDMFTEAQWTAQVATLLERQRGAFKAGDSVLEVGVGAGAFINALDQLFTGCTLYGVDYSAALIDIARRRLRGRFDVCLAEKLDGAFKDVEAFDHVVTFGMITYLDSAMKVLLAFQQMLGRARKTIYVGEVSDAAKEEAALAARRQTHTAATQSQQSASSALDTTHLYVPKSLWIDECRRRNVSIEIVDHDAIGLTYPTAKYRYSVYIDMQRPFSNKRKQQTLDE